MACGCEQNPKNAGGVLTLRCLAPLGCDIPPWGGRDMGETYILPCELACALALAQPDRFAVVADPPEAAPATKKIKEAHNG